MRPMAPGVRSDIIDRRHAASPPHPCLSPLFGPETSRTGVRGHREQFRAFCAGRFGMPFEDKSAMRSEVGVRALGAADGGECECACAGASGSAGRVAHKLIARYRAEGEAGLAERSRRPRVEPGAQRRRRSRRRCFRLRRGEPGLGRAQDRAGPARRGDRHVRRPRR